MLRSTLSLVLLTGVAASTGGSDIDSIYSHLFSDGSGYNKNTIPLPTDGPVNLEIGLSLINMDLVRQVMSATAWVWMRWTDYRLGWDPALFGGIEVIRVPGHVIWTPDIEVYNSADFGGSSFHDRMSRDTFLTLVYWNSTVLSVPAMPIEAICAEADITLPESSAQSCNVKIGSWTFDGHRIELTPYHSWGTRELLDHIDFSEMRNSAWVVTSQKDDVRKTNHYPGSALPYYAMEYDFVMQKAHVLQDGSMVENPSLPEPLAAIYAKYRAGDNMINAGI